ncbi:23S rRNA m(5)U-1939 methyltransferase [Tranquillimonas rosea]|uniref:23S rRNA m(5)U-1939 methyltransferase n=1 Tax=Tranquillimonas rosea TaxID=641238 RepID=A0A1H9UHC6_9RHOB|nr:class I SAM-dependent RNA methyltransferase [Tranquillimonas rosea]SES08749.1 23S rRNA m(5)U-1939 methyltransferase [Tranquillimonas rosea]
MDTYTIERLGRHGDGIAPGPVYVPRTLPGETVSGTVEGDRIPAPRIVTPAAERVSPRCRHYKGCGGCHLMHADDAFVSGWKADVVRTALAAQGIEAGIRGVTTSPPNSRRRATLSGRRTKKGALVGFHGRASGTITEIPDCHLLEPALIDALPALEAITEAGASRKGELDLAVTLSEAGVDLEVRGGKPLDPTLTVELTRLAGHHGLARLSWEGEVILTARPPVQRLGAAQVVPPPGGFLQATAHGQAALTDAVRQAVGGARHVIDLFAGCGTFTLPLAETAEIRAVEGEAAMLAALDRGWRHAQGLRRVTTETRDLFRRPLMADELKGYEAAVIDPPRAGAEAQTAELAAGGPPVIAAVSCNPATFARDARLLVDAGYRIDWIEVVDQFRWSPHVELAARLSRDHIAAR